MSAPLSGSCLAALVAGVLCISAHGQTARQAFEVASIRPATPLGPQGLRADRTGGPGTADPGMYSCRNCPVSWVLSEAFDVQPFEFTGPGWLQAERFDFMAKVPPGTSKDAFRAMLQSLLVDRFQMTTHREKKPMTVYELTVARNGPKFHEGAPPESLTETGPPGEPKLDRDGFPILNSRMSMAAVPGHARIRSTNQPISWFVRMLSGQLQSPVLDATALSGKYDFQVSWEYDDDVRTPDAPNPYRSSLIQAVQSQLGLKLEQKKGEAEVLIVDRIQKTPTEN